MPQAIEANEARETGTQRVVDSARGSGSGPAKTKKRSKHQLEVQIKAQAEVQTEVPVGKRKKHKKKRVEDHSFSYCYDMTDIPLMNNREECVKLMRLIQGSYFEFPELGELEDETTYAEIACGNFKSMACTNRIIGLYHRKMSSATAKEEEANKFLADARKEGDRAKRLLVKAQAERDQLRDYDVAKDLAEALDKWATEKRRSETPEKCLIELHKEASVMEAERKQFEYSEKLLADKTKLKGELHREREMRAECVRDIGDLVASCNSKFQKVKKSLTYQNESKNAVMMYVQARGVLRCMHGYKSQGVSISNSEIERLKSDEKLWKTRVEAIDVTALGEDDLVVSLSRSYQVPASLIPMSPRDQFPETPSMS